jgi:hypothetical protein
MADHAPASGEVQLNGLPKNRAGHSFGKARFRFSLRSMLVVVLIIAALLAGRLSREFYPSLWFLGRPRLSVPPQTAYVEAGATLYVATNRPVPQMAVRDQTICEAAADSPTQLRLLGKKPGTTTVLDWLQRREEPVELSVIVAASR